jgi:hypothetical protein
MVAAMKTFGRWLKIMLLCRLLGRHGQSVEVTLSEDVYWTECERCRTQFAMTKRGAYHQFEPPPAWGAARGDYDGGLHR